MPQLGDFEGHWKIERRIEDRRAGRTGSFEGNVLFIDDGIGLKYRERGTLIWPGQPEMAAARGYLWRSGRDGIEVFYNDGRPFHGIAAGARVVQDWHDCHPDHYEVTYNFSHWPIWRAIWKVTGPEKDYISISDYARA